MLAFFQNPIYSSNLPYLHTSSISQLRSTMPLSLRKKTISDVQDVDISVVVEEGADFVETVIENSGIPRKSIIFPYDLDRRLWNCGMESWGNFEDIKVYVSPDYISPKEKATKVLMEDFSKLLNDSDTADFTLKTNNKSFRIHKLIFGARSCVFQAMFQSNMAEALVGEATIDDLDDDTVEEMIHFIYTGRLSGRQIDKPSLLYAAKKYQLDSLKHLVILDLQADLDVDEGTAEEPGKLADIFIASKLFKDLFDIARRKMKKEMLEDASFKEKMEEHPVLLSKIKENF